MQQLKVATILPKANPAPPAPGSKSKFNFQNMVMLHIKGNHECSNMVSNADRGKINKKHIKRNFYQRPVPYSLMGLEGRGQRGQKIKIQLFQIMVLLNIKLKRNQECSNVVRICLQTPSHPTRPLGSKFNFYRTWSYQIK